MDSMREDRVRRHTPDNVNERIDQRAKANLLYYSQADRKEIDDRIRKLRQEWDMERVLETNAASLTIASLALGVLASRRWFLLPAVIAGFLLQHALQGWCPPVSLFRRLGIRTRHEIDQEIYALKSLRGDFEGAKASENSTDGAVKAMSAVALT